MREKKEGQKKGRREKEKRAGGRKEEGKREEAGKKGKDEKKGDPINHTTALKMSVMNASLGGEVFLRSPRGVAVAAMLVAAAILGVGVGIGLLLGARDEAPQAEMDVSQGASAFRALSFSPASRHVQLQDKFDSLGPAVRSLTLPSGRVVNFADTGGKRSCRVAVEVTGAGTSGRALILSEFLRTSREALCVRIISVERNGFGTTLFNESLGFEDYTSDVLAVLQHVGVNRFSLIGVSAGGAYAAHIAAAVPSRIVSLHLAAALRVLPQTSPLYGLDDATLAFVLASQTADPSVWWAEPADAPVRRVPGWMEAAADEGSRAFFVRGQLNDPRPIVHEVKLLMLPPADVSMVTAPAYLFAGAADTTVDLAQLTLWESVLPNVARKTIYPAEEHTVIYRHWDQLLVDVAGLGNQTVLSIKGRTQLVPRHRVAALLERGATLGIAAWAPPRSRGGEE